MASGDVTPADDTALAPLRVVIAEDDALLREGIASLLRDAGHQVVGTAADAPTLMLKIRSYVPDVAILDLRMPPGDVDAGLVAASEIRRFHPTVSVLVLSQHLEPAYMLELVGDNASGVGYLLKERVGDVRGFVDSVERVAAGGTALDRSVVAELVHAREGGGDAFADLTPREREVIELMAEGKTNAAIARAMVVQPGAVEKHISSIFNKLDLPATDDDHRRVLAVLAFLRSA